MTLKTIATGSTGNCYVLTADNGEHLILDAGVPIAEIKKGLDFDIAHTVGAIITHSHLDHVMSADKIANFAPVWKPYEYEAKRAHTRLGSFSIESFDVPHNGTENRAFLIYIDGTTILYCTDAEYIPYSLINKNVNVMLIEMNYQRDRIINIDEHRQHTVLGHMEEQTTIGVITHNIKYLRKVILCHMSKSGALDRELAMQRMREVIPEYITIDFAKSGAIYNLGECPF